MKFTPPRLFSTPFILYTPASEMVLGVLTKTFAEAETNPLFFGSFQTYGGTEKIESGILTVVNTANITTWYRPDIQANCMVQTPDGYMWEIIGMPENIEMRNIYLRFKVKYYGVGT